MKSFFIKLWRVLLNAGSYNKAFCDLNHLKKYQTFPYVMYRTVFFFEINLHEFALITDRNE